MDRSKDLKLQGSWKVVAMKKRSKDRPSLPESKITGDLERRLATFSTLMLSVVLLWQFGQNLIGV